VIGTAANGACLLNHAKRASYSLTKRESAVMLLPRFVIGDAATKLGSLLPSSLTFGSVHLQDPELLSVFYLDAVMRNRQSRHGVLEFPSVVDRYHVTMVCADTIVWALVTRML
jgi:hypothetical protein